MKKNKKKSIVLFTAAFLSLIFMISFTSCTLLGGFGTTTAATATELTTFTVKIGNIIQSVSTTGSVDTSQTINYSLQVSGKVLQVLKAESTFKKGNVLIELDNSDCVAKISDLEDSLQTAEDSLASSKNSLTTAKINYQNALDANHITIQLVDLNTQKAQEAAASALLSLENANRSADLAYTSAISSLENTEYIKNLSVISAQSALDEAKRLLAATPGDPILEYNVKIADQKLAQAEADRQSSITNAEDNIGSTDIQNSNSGNSAQNSYEQALIGQSSTYWNNLSSLQSAEAQIKLVKVNISDAGLKLKQAERSVENSKQDIEDVKQDLNDYKITAPFDGIVLTSNYNPGAFASGPAVSIISNTFVIKTVINEIDINKIKIGQDVDITLNALPNQQFHGKVSDISPISKNTLNVVTYTVTIKPDDSVNSKLLYGLSSNLTIIQASAQNVLLVPSQAVYKQNDKQYVDIYTVPATEKINPQDISKYIKQVEVTTGISNYNYIEIKSGLKEGDVVIASNTGKLNTLTTEEGSQASTSTTGGADGGENQQE